MRLGSWMMVACDACVSDMKREFEILIYLLHEKIHGDRVDSRMS